MIKINRPACILPKYLYGQKEFGFSPEYNAIYLPLKKKFPNIKFFDSLGIKNIKSLNKKIINFCTKEKIDFIFFSVYHYEIYTETLKELKLSLGIYLVNWSSDDSWRFNQHSKLLSSYFDTMITTSKEANSYYKKNKKNSILASWGCPDHWYAKPISFKYCKYDILFVGKSYFDRKKIITNLKKDKFNVTCYGSDWGTRSLDNKEVFKKIRQSKISLNFSKSRGGIKQTKARVFEIMGSGGFCLTEKSPEIYNFFKKSDLETFSSYQDLKKKLKKYLNNEMLRQKVANEGNKKVKKFFYSTIIKKILNQLQYTRHQGDTFKSQLDKKESLILYLIFWTYKNLGLLILKTIFTEKKTIKILRRILFEVEWRLRGELVYSKYGWCSKFFDVF